MLLKQKGGAGMDIMSPRERLAKALCVLNFLNCWDESGPPFVKHFMSMWGDHRQVDGKPLVKVKNLETGQWEGPFHLVTLGSGYACVSTGNGPRWIPARCVQPHMSSSDGSK